MSNSAFSFRARNVTQIIDNGLVNISSSLNQTIGGYQVFDWVPLPSCAYVGQILYRRTDGTWQPATADTAERAEAIGVLEQISGCGSGSIGKLVYYGRLDFDPSENMIVQDGAVYYVATSSVDDATNLGPQQIRNATVFEPFISKPMYVGTGPRRAVVVNYRALAGANTSSVPPIPQVILSVGSSCPVGGSRFTVYNNGSLGMSVPHNYTVTSASLTIATGSFQLNAGASQNIDLTGFYGTISFDSTGSYGLLTTISNCAAPVPMTYIYVRQYLDDLGFGQPPPEPSAVTFWQSDPTAGGGPVTVTWPITQTYAPGSVSVLEFSGSLPSEALNPSGITATFASGSFSTYSNTFVYDSGSNKWFSTNPPLLSTRLVSISMTLP